MLPVPFILFIILLLLRKCMLFNVFASSFYSILFNIFNNFNVYIHIYIFFFIFCFVGLSVQ